MKTTLKLILFVIPVFFFSCQKDEITPSVASSITSSGTLSGIISGYVPNTIDTVKAKVEGENILIGTGKVTSTGGFSIGVSIPELSKIGSKSGLVVSDSTAMTGSLSVGGYKNGVFYSELGKSSCSQDSMDIAGSSSSAFVYSDRDFTVKGTYSYTYDYYGAITYSTNVTYQVTIKKGWNELVEKLNSTTATATAITTSLTVSNNITSDLKWRYTNNGYFINEVKRNGVSSVKSQKSFLLFRRK